MSTSGQPVMSYTRTKAYHVTHVAAGIPDILEADDVGRFAKERVGGLDFSHGVGLPFVCFCVKGGLKMANEFDARRGACKH